MRLNKIRIIITLIIIIVSIIMSSFSAVAAQLEITVQSSESVNIGHSFDIVFSSNSSLNVKAIQFNVGYNTNYISFKAAKNIQSAEVNVHDDKGKLGIIILFDNVLKKGDFLTLTFTAKTNNNSSIQNISFEFIEAVDTNLNDISVKMPGTAKVEIVKKSEQDSNTGSKSTSSSSITSKSSGSNVKSKSTSSVKTSSDKKTSNTDSDRTRSISSDSNVTSDKSVASSKTNTTGENDDNVTSISQLDSGNSIGSLNSDTSKWKYVFAGIGGTVSIIGILFTVFRLGQLSRRKPESDKIFPKDDNADKW